MPSIAIMAKRLLISSALTGLLALLLYAQQSVLYAALDSLLPRTSTAINDLLIETTHDHAWDQLYHLGGNSPWIPKLDGVVTTDVTAPAGCRVDQVHMVGQRHLQQVGSHLTVFSFICSCQGMRSAILPLRRESVGRNMIAQSCCHPISRAMARD